jgi:hypothetical protein
MPGNTPEGSESPERHSFTHLRNWPKEEIPLVIAREKRMSRVGQQDEQVTKTLQGYRLPEQSDINHKPRYLVDVEEYLLKVSGEKGWKELRQIADEDYQHIQQWAEWQGTYLGIIFGNPEKPYTCYRYSVKEIIENTNGTITIVVNNNIQHEKDMNINLDEPNEIGENWVVGERTGITIVHQRAPLAMTMMGDVNRFTIDPEKDTAWVVVESGSGIEKASRPRG